jgi:D-tyrosyl-tRNA(Tyr) deacylase
VRALVQRVRHAAVDVGGRTVGSIEAGLLVFLGVGRSDTEDEAQRLAQKIVELRIFAEGEKGMQRSLADVGGRILLVSQFTLYADCRRGRRPSFDAAAAPADAERLYRVFAACLADLGHTPQEGVFGADMQVRLENDGPVTIWLEVPWPEVS